jgi:hypothetical protein
VPSGGEMALVATVNGAKIHQHYGDHPPPHFHAYHGDDEVLLTISVPVTVYRGGLAPAVQRNVVDWATLHLAELALNWLEAEAGRPVARIP